MLRISKINLLRSVPKFKPIDPLNKTIQPTQKNKNHEKIPISKNPSGPNADLLVSKTATNKNPRNLELLQLQTRDDGWGKLKMENHDSKSLKNVTDNFWKKCSTFPQKDAYFNLFVFFQKGRTTAVIEHTKSQTVVLSASTKEWQIGRRLYSPDDVTAAFNIGRILGDRALMCGINKCHLVHRDAYNLHKMYEKENQQLSYWFGFWRFFSFHCFIK